MSLFWCFSRFERPANTFNRIREDRRPESDHRKVDMRHSSHSSRERYGDSGKGMLKFFT